MTISFTGIAYGVAFLSLTFLLHRFYHYWQKDKTPVSGLFVYSVALFDLFFFIAAIGGIFFAQNQQVLKGVVAVSTFLQGLAAAIVAYMAVIIRFQRVPPWLVFVSILSIGIAATALIVIGRTNPFLEPDGAINWDTGGSLTGTVANYLRSFTFFRAFIPTVIVLFRQSEFSKTLEARVRALGIGILFLIGLVVGLLDFNLERSLGLATISSDIAIILFSIVPVIILLVIGA